MRLSRLWTDEGSASIEFITAGMILLLPLVYLVLTMSALQAGSFAVEGAARQAVRVFVQAGTENEAESEAQRAIEFALADNGIDADAAQVTIVCSPNPSLCLHRHGTVRVTVTTRVTLPLVPPVLSLDEPLSIPIEATAAEQVSRFWSAG